MKGYSVTEKTGKVVAVKVVDGDEDVMLVSDDGIIIRMAVSDINVYGRSAQGVRVMRLDEGVKVISIARAEKDGADTPDGSFQD